VVGVLETSARLLRLLSLLQARQDLVGCGAGRRLERGRATIRRDMDRRRQPRLPGARRAGARAAIAGAGAALPPLLLDDDEAVAVAIGLRTLRSGASAD